MLELQTLKEEPRRQIIQALYVALAETTNMSFMFSNSTCASDRFTTEVIRSVLSNHVIEDSVAVLVARVLRMMPVLLDAYEDHQAASKCLCIDVPEDYWTVYFNLAHIVEG